MLRQDTSGYTRIVRFVDCIGEHIYYFEVQETGNDAHNTQAAVNRFRQAMGHDPHECCMHCGDRRYNSYLLNNDEMIPDRSLDYLFPLA